MKKDLCSGFICVLVTASIVFGNAQLVSYQEGGNVSLSNSSNYDWWYGCSPTSAGMLLSWYDRNGFGNLAPGGDAELDNFTGTGMIGKNMIASSGHINDFYGGLSPSAGYGIKNDDIATTRQFDCLSDLMGTNQDAYGNSNGSTTFWYYGDNSPITYTNMYNLGASYYNDSGMYGIYEYITYRGYQVGQLYNQRIYGYNNINNGFTFADYKNQIDLGRGVLIHIDGHTMYGYGYQEGTNNILVADTWETGTHTMTWGGSYSGSEHYGVTVVEIIPEPITIALLVLGSVFVRKHKS